MADIIRRKQQTSLPIANRRNTKKNTTLRMALHTHLASYGRGGVFLSAKIERIQREKRRTNDDNRPIAERGQRRGNPPTPQAHTKGRLP